MQLPKFDDGCNFWVFDVPATKNLWSMGPDSVPSVNLLLRLFVTVLASPQKGSDENVIWD